MPFFSCTHKDVLSDYQKTIKYLNNQAFKERLYDSKLSLHYADSALYLLYSDSVNLIENDPDFYSSSIPYGLHDDFSSNKLQNKKCNNIIRNKRCKISFNCSTFNHQKCMKTIFTPYGNL